MTKSSRRTVKRPTPPAISGDDAGWCVAAADRCVMCGLCLPHCPTYMLERHEADSPRGRISLIRALAAAKLAPDPALVGHLNGCLHCRRCEAVCPAQVPFGRLMDTARHLLHDARTPSLTRLPFWLDWLTRSRALRRFVRFKLYLYQVTGLRRLLRASRILKLLRLDALDAMLPAIDRTPLRSTPAQHTDSDKQVVLFTGCIAEIADRDTLTASQHLLEAAGFSVAIPARQRCCGALHQHAGNFAQAERLRRDSAAVFAAGTNTTAQTVVSCASGCGAQLQEHQTQLGIRHFDIHTLLVGSDETAHRLEFLPLDRTVAVHTPCTMETCLHGADAVTALLTRVPKLKLLPLPNNGCCGAAGAAMLTQTNSVRQLLAKTLQPVAAAAPEILLSSNIGCMMHLRQGIARRGLDIEVTHPAVLLQRQLKPGH